MFKIKSFIELSDAEFQELSNIDLVTIQKYGLSFSNEVWYIKNFKYSLPKKETMSYILLYNDKLIGYIVASEKQSSIYIHRFVVTKTGSAKVFFNMLMETYLSKSIYLMVSIINQRAINFYKKYNFTIVYDESIVKEFISNKLAIQKGEIIIEENYRCYLMKKN